MRSNHRCCKLPVHPQPQHARTPDEQSWACQERDMASRHVQEEMESLVGKACKQAISSLGQMSTVLAADNSRHVCGVSTTRMLCPDLIHQLDTAVTCLGSIPIILERTIQLGRENEFFFEVLPAAVVSSYADACLRSSLPSPCNTCRRFWHLMVW